MIKKIFIIIALNFYCHCYAYEVNNKYVDDPIEYFKMTLVILKIIVVNPVLNNAYRKLFFLKCTLINLCENNYVEYEADYFDLTEQVMESNEENIKKALRKCESNDCINFPKFK